MNHPVNSCLFPCQRKKTAIEVQVWFRGCMQLQITINGHLRISSLIYLIESNQQEDACGYQHYSDGNGDPGQGIVIEPNGICTVVSIPVRRGVEDAVDQIDHPRNLKEIIKNVMHP